MNLLLGVGQATNGAGGAPPPSALLINEVNYNMEAININIENEIF